MTRLVDLLKALFAVAVSVGLLVGVPAALVTVVGWPLPTETVAFDTIRHHLDSGDVPDVVIIKTLACIVWLTWLQLAVAFLIELGAALRGRAARRAPVLPALQIAAARLVTTIMLAVHVVAPVRIAAAAPLQPLPVGVAAAVMVEPEQSAVGVLSGADAVFASAAESVAPDDRYYETRRGDTWWAMAERLVGDGTRWSELRDLNVGRTQPDGTVITDVTDAVRAGWRLAVPADTDPSLLTTTAAGEAVDVIAGWSDHAETVDVGDNLWALTSEWIEHELGRPPSKAEIHANWIRVVALNTEAGTLRSDDPDLIFPGEVILVPDETVDDDGAAVVDADVRDRVDEVEAEPVAEITDAAAWVGPGDVVAEKPATPADPVEPTESVAATPAPSEPRTPVPAAAAASTARSESSDGGGGASSGLAPVVVLAGMTPMLGGIIAWRLGWLRRLQMRRRRPGQPLVTSPVDAELEETIRVIGAHGASAWTDATLRYLTAQLRESATATPDVVMVRAGTDNIEILLSDAVDELPDGFVALTDTGRVIGLAPDLELDDLVVAAGETPCSPALVTIGTTDDGDVLLNLESASVVSVDGDQRAVEGLLRAVVTSLANASWSTDTTVLVVGLDIDTDVVAAGGHEVRTLDLDDEEAVDTIERRATATAAHHGGISGADARTAPNTHEAWPVTVIVAAEPHPDLDRLAAAAELTGSCLAVIAPDGLDDAPYRIEIRDDGSTQLHPFGLKLVVASVDHDVFAGVGRLITAAADAGPPVQVAQVVEISDGAEEAPSCEPTMVSDGPTLAVVPAASAPTELPAAIAVINEPRPIEIALLNDIPEVHGVDQKPEPRPTEMIAYLALRIDETITTEQLRTAIYPDGVADSTFRTSISRIRKLLGDNRDGSPRLSSASNSGVLGLSGEVGTDWSRIQQLLGLDNSTRPHVERVTILRAALQLVRGRAFSAVPPGRYGWVYDSRQVLSLIEVVLVDAADELARLAFELGDPALSIWAADQGLRIVPDQEALYRRKMQAADQAGNPDAIDTAYRHACRAAQTIDPLDDVQPETQALYERLKAMRENRPATAGT